METCADLASGESDGAACDKVKGLMTSNHRLPRLLAGPNRKVVTRSHSTPVAGSRPRQVGENRPKSAIQSQSLSTAHVSLEVGSMVEVVSNSGVTVYGVVQWLGVPEGKTAKWAGIELVSEYNFHFAFSFIVRRLPDLVFLFAGL